jgi:hypothetical protein
MLNFKKVVSAVIFFILSGVVSAHEIAPTNIAVYIQAQEYNHQIMLRNYSQNYWYSQGPMLETAAHDVLGADFSGVDMCDAQPAGAKVVLWLRPRMFYNPQMQTFYGKVIAVTYTADGKPLANYVGEATKRAFFDVKTELTLSDVYHAAMQAVSAKMKADEKLQAALNAPSFSSPCATVSVLPEPKIQFMSFQ